MPRRTYPKKSRAQRIRDARARDAATERLKARTVKLTRRQTRREEQKKAWARLPSWINRRNGQ